MTKHLPNLHHVDELKNFAANNLFRLVFLKSRIRIRATVSHVLGSRASERETVTTKQVQVGIGVRVQLKVGKVLGIPCL